MKIHMFYLSFSYTANAISNSSLRLHNLDLFDPSLSTP